jgi:hypothetical protein
MMSMRDMTYVQKCNRRAATIIDDHASTVFLHQQQVPLRGPRAGTVARMTALDQRSRMSGLRSRDSGMTASRVPAGVIDGHSGIAL